MGRFDHVRDSFSRGFTNVESMERHAGGTVVEVRFAGIEAVPDFVAETRARGRALLHAGPVETGMESVRDLSMGKVDRLTEVTKKRNESMGAGVVDKIYTVRVKNSE